MSLEDSKRVILDRKIEIESKSIEQLVNDLTLSIKVKYIGKLPENIDRNIEYEFEIVEPGKIRILINRTRALVCHSTNAIFYIRDVRTQELISILGM